MTFPSTDSRLLSVFGSPSAFLTPESDTSNIFTSTELNASGFTSPSTLLNVSWLGMESVRNSLLANLACAFQKSWAPRQESAPASVARKSMRRMSLSLYVVLRSILESGTVSSILSSFLHITRAFSFPIRSSLMSLSRLISAICILSWLISISPPFP